jgi:hypothetical protein
MIDGLRAETNNPETYVRQHNACCKPEPIINGTLLLINGKFLLINLIRNFNLKLVPILNTSEPLGFHG